MGRADLCPPGGSLLAEPTPDLPVFFDAGNAALERNDIEAAVEATVASWVIGPGRSESDVDAAVSGAVRRMQPTAFEIGASWGEVDEAEPGPPALDRLADLDLPVGVLVGGHDLDTVQDAAARVSAGAPYARLTNWADVAHLLGWIRGQEPGAGR